MAVDNKTKRKELLAQLRELPPQNRAEDVSALLEARRRGEKRRPSRICGDLLPYRYATDPEVDLGREIISVSVFVNLAHYLSKHDVLALARDASLFEKAKESLEGEELPSSWSDSLREWSKTSPDLGLQLYCEIRGVHVNPRKRGTDTPVPEPKRRCIAVQCDYQGTTTANRPPTRVEEPEAAGVANTVDPESDTVATSSKSAATIADAPDQKAESSRKTQPADEASPAETSRLRGMDMAYQGKPGDGTALSLEARRKIITATLSRCYVAVYPVQTFADLIKQSGQDVKFSRHPSHTEHYCSQKIGSGATGFYIRFTQDAFEEIEYDAKGHGFIVPVPLLASLFEAGCRNYATSIFWHLRGSVTHIRKGCDIVWEAAPDWIYFLTYLRSIRSQVPEFSSLQAMLLSYPGGTKAAVIPSVLPAPSPAPKSLS